MKFKEWFIKEANKGLMRYFKQQRPNLPDYVAKQVLQNRIAPLWPNVVASKQPTTSPLQPTIILPNQSKPTYSNIQDMLGDESIGSISDNKNWILKVIDVHPLIFTPDTIQAFLSHQFGSSPSLNRGIKNHEERMNTQSALSAERGDQNEPIIVTQKGDKFKMQEGWHRLYSYLMNFSAPPEERQKIQNGKIHEVDFAVWKPVKMRAYVGN